MDWRKFNLFSLLGGALLNQLPCIYSSVASPLGVVQHLCRQLGLPLACIRPVPVNTVFGQYTFIFIEKHEVCAKNATLND